MYEFILTATDRRGVRSTRQVFAQSAGDAVAELESEGYTDIVLHTDDAGAAATATMPAVDTDEVTPRDMVELRSLSALGYCAWLFNKLLGSTWPTLAVSAAFLAWQLVSNRPLGFLPSSVTTIALMLLIAIHFAFFSYPRQYDRLLEAWAWGRWETVLELAPKLRGKAPDFELDAREAVALGKLGWVKEGLRKMERHAASEEVPRWMYLGRLAEFFECLERHEEELRCHKEAYEDAPENPTVELDYAMSLLRNEADTYLAARLIDSAESKPLSDILQMVLPHIHGLRELNAGRYSNAVLLFQRAKSQLAPLAGQPLVRLALDTNDAYLAIACARAGDLDSARQVSGSARKRLQAISAQRLLDRLNRELGTSA